MLLADGVKLCGAFYFNSIGAGTTHDQLAPQAQFAPRMTDQLAQHSHS